MTRHLARVCTLNGEFCAQEHGRKLFPEGLWVTAWTGLNPHAAPCEDELISFSSVFNFCHGSPFEQEGLAVPPPNQEGLAAPPGAGRPAIHGGRPTPNANSSRLVTFGPAGCRTTKNSDVDRGRHLVSIILSEFLLISRGAATRQKCQATTPS